MATRSVNQSKARKMKSTPATKRATHAPTPKPATTPQADAKEGHKALTAPAQKSTPPTTATPAAPAPTATPASAGKALVKHQAPEQSEVPPEESLTVPLAVLRAALMAAPKKDVRYYLQGIYLRAASDTEIHVVGTDGHRLFAAAVPSGEKMPSWAKRGLILSREWLNDALGVIGKLGDSVTIAYAPEGLHASFSDSHNIARFRVAVVDATYPDYLKILQGSSQALHASPGALESVGLDPKYVKDAGQVAAALGAKCITPFVGEPTHPVMFAFKCDVPAWLYIMPMRNDAGTDVRALAMIGPGLKGTLAALKAHRTRLASARKESKDDAAKEIAAKIARIDERIEEIMQLATKHPALPKAA